MRKRNHSLTDLGRQPIAQPARQMLRTPGDMDLGSFEPNRTARFGPMAVPRAWLRANGEALLQYGA
jgi:hypothetical protein